jgi:hypothetical protein
MIHIDPRQFFFNYLHNSIFFISFCFYSVKFDLILKVLCFDFLLEADTCLIF